MRKPSARTELRNLRREVKLLREALHSEKMAGISIRFRLQTAEKDRDEWKGRFDRLLDRVPNEALA